MGYPEESVEESPRLICPKCGYEQEERLDCLKCGIVFSKFIAFHSPEKTAKPDSVESAQGPSLPPEDTAAFDASEMRQQIKELSRRFNEVEFERVERSQLRSDLRALDRKSQAYFEQLASRLEALERLVNEPPTPPPAPTGPDYAELIRNLRSTEIEPLIQKLDELEHRFGEVVELVAQQPDSQIVALLEKLDARATSLETQLAGIRAENDSKASVSTTQNIESRLESLQTELGILGAIPDPTVALGYQISELREQTDLTRQKLQSLEDKLEHLSSLACHEEQPREPIEEDVHYIRESLDQIRKSLARLSPQS